MATLSGKWKFGEAVTALEDDYRVEFYALGRGDKITLYYGFSYSGNLSYYVEDDLTVSAVVTDENGVFTNEKYRTVDFGQEPQMVSEDFYTWFTTNAKKNQVIKAGTYRFNDEVAITASLQANIGFTVSGYLAEYDTTVEATCSEINVYYFEEEASEIQFRVESTTPDLGVTGNQIVYAGGEGWRNEDYGIDLQTIIVTEDTEVSYEFYEWFTANADEVEEEIPEPEPKPEGDSKPVYLKAGGEWVKQNAFERRSGEWVRISTVEEADIVWDISATKSDHVIASYYEDTQTLTISGSGEMKPMGSTSQPWQEYKTTLSKVVINDGVTNITSFAFYDCTSLTSITIPDSVTWIGSRAFYGCTSLTSIVIPDSVTIINEGAFIECGALESITIPDGVADINHYTFYNCTSLTSVTIGNNVTRIYSQAFYGCRSLTSITIPDGVTSIGYSAFSGCSNLTSITIPDSVTSIGEDAFYGCTKLVYNEYDNAYYLGNENNPYVALVRAKTTQIISCEINSATRLIASYAFSGRMRLTSIVIPNSVTHIGSYAFYRCTSLTSIVIPDSVTRINYSAFRYCRSLTDIYYQGTEAEWSNINIEEDAIPDNVTIHYNTVV